MRIETFRFPFRCRRNSGHVMILLAASFLLSATNALSADVVTDWNNVATTVGSPAGVPQSRAYAMAQAAVHDALNAIDRRYEPYAYEATAPPNASPEAAVSAAAHDVLRALFPSQQLAIDAAYQAALASIPSGNAKDFGVAVGQAAAAAVLALRSNDGSATANIPYTQPPGPGVWEPTPPGFLPAAFPGWGNVTTFGLNHGEQFRPDPPEFFVLTSEAYTREYQEVKDIGNINSITRTPEQSDIARFWYEGSPPGWNRIARVVAAQKGFNLWENARLFALVNFAMADGLIAGFNAKYFYNFWRPVTAIQKGDADGNPSTVADPGWSSFLITPQIPDYPSTHSVLGAAAAEVLSRFVGTDLVSFTTTSGAPFAGITRSFTSFSQAALENANSRVLAGIHFRSATTDGVRQGENIGKFIFKHSLKPVKKQR